MTKLPQKDESKITLVSNQVHFKPKPGTMIIFPGYYHMNICRCWFRDFRFIHWNIKAVETTISKEKVLIYMTLPKK